MGLYIIARLHQQGKEIGYRVFNTDNDRYVDKPTTSVIEALGFKVFDLVNAEVDSNGKLKGITGVLKNYPLLDVDTDTVIGSNSYTIVGKTHEEGLLKTVDGYGIPRDMSEQYLVSMLNKSQNRGLTNAMLVNGYGRRKSHIRAKGSFEMVGFKYDYLEKEFKTPNDFGNVEKWVVRIIKTGEPYGLNGVLTNEKKPLVEFISKETNQFVSRYYLSTLLTDVDEKRGLSLQGDVPTWSIDAENYKKIIKWLGSLSI